LGGGRPPIQVQSCTVSFAPGAMHPAFVQMYRAKVTDVLARHCPAMSSEMAHFVLMKCNKIKHACLPGAGLPEVLVVVGGCPGQEVDYTTKMHVKGRHWRHTRKTGKCQ
jgi:hypothetical protein